MSEPAIRLYLHNNLPANLVARDSGDRWYILGASTSKMWAERREFFPAPAYAKTFQPASIFPRGPLAQSTDLPPVVGR